jgi:hypothetical protein
MHNLSLDLQKTAFRVIVGVVMVILFLFPTSITFWGTGPMRTGIWNLPIPEAAVAIDVTTTPSQDREDNYMIESFTKIMLEERREDNPLNLSEEEVQALAAHSVRYQRRLTNGERLPPCPSFRRGDPLLLHAATMPGGQQLVAMLRTELPEIPEHFDEQGQRDFIAQLVRNLSKENGLSLIAEQTQRGVVEVMLSNYRAKVARERQQVGRASPPATPPASPTPAPAPATTQSPEPPPQAEARPNVEIISVPSSDWRAYQPAKPEREERPNRFLGELLWGRIDRMEKPGEQRIPVDVSAMIQEQLLILIASSILWITMFGIPNTLLKPEK